MISNRPYETDALGREGVPAPSGDFRKDIMGFVAWCAETQRNERYPRIILKMKPEPYGATWGRPGHDLDATTLQQQVESTLGGAWEAWSWLYRRLGDAWSRELLLTVLAYRSIGWRYVRLPLDNDAFWNILDEIRAEKVANRRASGAQPLRSGRYILSKRDLAPYGFKGFAYTDDFGLFNEFVYSQYIYRGENFLIAPTRGDYIIDCGACFGGTTIHFAHKVGPKGRILSFEFVPDNLEVYRSNLDLTPALGKRIHLVEAPVWSEPDVRMAMVGRGPAAQVHLVPEGASAGKNEVRAVTIDQEVERLSFPRVDLIKMDIEGSEFQALQGARRTIENFKPALAISVYHKLCDFYDVPQLIDGWGLDYDFYLQHSTPHGDETVIFGTPRDRRKTITRS